MPLTVGARGHFSIVLSVRRRGAIGLVARCQSVPKATDSRVRRVTDYTDCSLKEPVEAVKTIEFTQLRYGGKLLG